MKVEADGALRKHCTGPGEDDAAGNSVACQRCRDLLDLSLVFGECDICRTNFQQCIQAWYFRPDRSNVRCSHHPGSRQIVPLSGESEINFRQARGSVLRSKQSHRMSTAPESL